MLDESEYRRVVLERTAFSEKIATPSADMGMLKVEWAERMIDAYEEVTGVRETDWTRIYHHRVACYGDACPKCRKPLRSPKAKFCAGCGATKA